MKKIMTVVCVVLMIASSAHALMIKISPETINPIDTGSSFKAEIIAENAADLAGFQLEVVYNSDIVSVSSVVFGNFLETSGRSVIQIPGMSGYEIDNDAGRLSCNVMTEGSGAGASGRGVLATVTFGVKSLSDDFLNLENVYLTDTKGSDLFAAAESAEISPGYHISASVSGNGIISPSGDVLVKPGETQIFDIQPAACYHIADVSADGVSKGTISRYSFVNVNENHTIQTSFDINRLVINASAGTWGSIFPVGNLTVACGQNQKFTITPDNGYRIKDVKADGVSKGKISEYIFPNVTANHTLYAEFYLAGDIDGNGSVDLGDAILALRIMCDISTENTTTIPDADVNGDGRIGMEEVIYILQKVAGLI